jgi:hydroxymethylpyrimidine/phosphomethylpyrimidine kinase
MKVVLTIAGSDSGGGAGIQADLKTFEAFGLFGASAITVLTAQNTLGVSDIQDVSCEFIKQQIISVLDDFDVKAIKIGMLYSSEIIETIKDIIKELDIPIILDPVFISKSNSKLLQDDAIKSLKSLFEYVTLVTPNLHEAKELFGYSPDDTYTHRQMLNLNYSVLVKNHLLKHIGSSKSVDILYHNNQKFCFDNKYIPSTNTHGTGCSYSSAIAANIALGKDILESIDTSKKFITQAIELAPSIGSGKGPISHKLGAESCLN